VSFEHKVPAVIIKELPAIKKKFGVSLALETNKITLSGIRMQVVHAKTEILELERVSGATFKAPPPHWDPQKSDLEIIEVVKSSAEWVKIENQIKETIPAAKIIRVQRVQNLSQWEKYCFLKDRISRKIGTDVNELHLFHGSNTNMPSLIYTGDDGFDMRYSSQGMWGRASYFAKNASYSYNFSYKLPDKSLQMFLAVVTVGNNQHIPSDKSIIKPADGYDSVSGETNFSVVYMVYENGRAYPEYLITYSV